MSITPQQKKEKERNGPFKSLLVEIKIDTKLSGRQYR